MDGRGVVTGDVWRTREKILRDTGLALEPRRPGVRARQHGGLSRAKAWLVN